jgi:hypothetical protein
MARNTLLFFAIGVLLHSATSEDRNGKFSIFNIIKFENAPCIGGTRNGTCFTASECDSSGGESDGECADGFGVCCIKKLSPGESVSLNQSYIVKATSDTLDATSNSYTICPCSSNVCRIRFDFTTFVIAGPTTLSTSTAGNGASGGLGGIVGDCTTDQFSIASSGSSPVICGTNTGQHMIMDTDGLTCAQANFDIGSAASAVSWDIMVTQYACGDENGGPVGCLQYFTGATGAIRSYNFASEASAAVVAQNQVHLSNQHYSACIRREALMGHICYIPCTVGANAVITQSSFGLSVGTGAAADAATDTICTADYIEIANAVTVANIVIVANNAPFGNRFCGRFFATSAATATVSLCSRQEPFQIAVHFDEDEQLAAAGAVATDESDSPPGGIVGFCLNYVQA